MTSNDKWTFGFITLWVVLCSGDPDLLDAVGKRIYSHTDSYEARYKEILKHNEKTNQIILKQQVIIEQLREGTIEGIITEGVEGLIQ